MKYCFLDLETTGFDPEKDSIIEASFICVDDDQIVDKFDQVFIPDKSGLSDFVADLTGINQSEINTKGKNFTDFVSSIEEKIKDRVIIGHNIDFDINFLIKNGIDIQKNKRIDTHELVRILCPLEASFALEVLSEKYGFNHGSAHRAMSDVLASWELYKFLLDKIDKLPLDYLNRVRYFLKNNTKWEARILFLESKGSNNIPQKSRENSVNNNYLEIPLEVQEKYNKTDNLFIKIGDNKPSINFYLDIINHYQKEGDKFLIITPKLDFFPTIKKIPLPEVIFNPKQLAVFLTQRKFLNNQETTFYLKCFYRHFLGYRGVDKFDLFFKERDLWKEVCVQSIEDVIFQDILTKRASESVLSITPNAFFQLRNSKLIEGRVLVIDEAEHFTEELLYTPIKKYNFAPFLNHKDEEVVNKTHFFIARCCQDLIEPKLEHKISQFPQKILLHEREIFSDIADEVSTFEESDLNNFVVKNLKKPTDKIVRFIEYFPESGNLSFNFWHPDDWRDLKNDLAKFKKIIGHRTEIIGESMPFFRIFLGINNGEFYINHDNFSSKELIIPQNLISHNSPDYNSFCGKIVLDFFNKNNGNLAVNFSSLETLRKSYDELITQDIDREKNFIAGEKVLGGDGKLIQLLQKNASKRILFLFRRFMRSDILDYKFQDIIIQKFPFNPPHPLLEKIEQVLKQSGQNFFDIWVLTQVAKNLSQNIANYEDTKQIVFLDPRENTKWGKNIIRRGLREFLQ